MQQAAWGETRGKTDAVPDQVRVPGYCCLRGIEQVSKRCAACRTGEGPRTVTAIYIERCRSVNARSRVGNEPELLTVMRNHVLYTSLAVLSFLNVSQRASAGGIVHFAWLFWARSRRQLRDRTASGWPREATHTSQ